MTTIAIIGSGRVATVLATKLVAAGHELVIGVRDVAKARSAWAGPNVDFAGIAAAASKAEIVINATPGDTTLELFTGLRDVMVGRILVDLSNATRRRADGLPGGLLYQDGSLAERLQGALPEALVVKTLNTMLFTVMTNPGGLCTPPTVFISGDDVATKARVRALLGDLGWYDEWIEDLGGHSKRSGYRGLGPACAVSAQGKRFRPIRCHCRSRIAHIVASKTTVEAFTP